MHWQNSVLTFLKQNSLLSYTKLCFYCIFLSVSQVHYWDRIHKAQHGPNGSADPTVLLYHCWWGDVFCYWSGVLLLTGKRSDVSPKIIHNRFLFCLFSFILILFPFFYASSRLLITWKQCCRQAGYSLLLLATSLCWLCLKLQSFPNRWVSICHIASGHDRH